MKKWILRGFLASTTLLFAAKAYTNADGPPARNTGAPGETTCAQSDCHNDFPLNSGTGSVGITGLPDQYTPGTTYDLTVTVARTEQVVGGFQLTVKKIDNSRGGNLTASTTNGTKFASNPPITSPQYLEHRQERVGSTATWNTQWIAPAAGSGTVTFYVAGNSANGNEEREGDRIYTNSFPVLEAIPQQPCIGDLNADKKVNVTDAILVLQDIVGIRLPAETRPRADVNGDTAIDVNDVVLMLQVAVGLNTSFPKECI